MIAWLVAAGATLVCAGSAAHVGIAAVLTRRTPTGEHLSYGVLSLVLVASAAILAVLAWERALA